MEKKQITYKSVDTGHWLARCNHSTNEIELNRREFFKLSPMYQEYVWIHEHVHLLCDVYNENECNRITDNIFLSRAETEEERIERIKFITRSNDYKKSNVVITGTAMLIAGLVTTLVATGTKVGMAGMAKRNSGYYSLSDADRELYVDSLLAESFAESLSTDQFSAKDIFWSKLQPSIARNKEQSYAGWYANNSFIRSYISKYENMYGFGFSDITPIQKQDKKTISIGVVAVLAALVVLALVIFTKKKK